MSSDSIRRRGDGGEIEHRRGRGMGKGCPPPQLTKGSGERRKLPQWGLGPAENGFWCILSLKEPTNLVFLPNGRPT